MGAIEIHDFTIGCDERGRNNQQTAIVFLHGVGSDKTMWRDHLDYFAETRRAIAFDYPGYGESDLAGDDTNREKVAALLLAALDRLEIERAHFCGLSMGGVIALEIYKQQPARVQSLILANTFAKHPNGDEIARRSLAFVEENSLRQFAEQRVNFLLAPETPEKIRSEVVETMARINKQTYRWASRAVWTADYLDLLLKINVPTLVIGGELDQPTPPALSQELAHKIPNAQLEIIKNAGHLSNLDQPATFNRRLRDFLVFAED